MQKCTRGRSGLYYLKSSMFHHQIKSFLKCNKNEKHLKMGKHYCLFIQCEISKGNMFDAQWF